MNSLQAFSQKVVSSLDKPSNLRRVLMTLGGLLLFGKAHRLLSFLYSHFLRPSYSLPLRYGRKSYVLFSTIGVDSLILALVEEFAFRGFNILILSDELVEEYQPKLKAIESKFKVEVNVISKFEESEQLDVSVFVMHRSSALKHKKFCDFLDEKLEKSLKTSIFTSLLQTKTMLRRFAVRPLKSAIISLNSFTGHVPCPHFSLSSAITAFHTMLFKSLAFEFNENVDVLSMNPLFVSEKKKNVGVCSITPNECAKECLRVLGRDKYSFGGARSSFQASRLESMPEDRKVKYFSSYLKRFLST